MLGIQRVFSKSLVFIKQLKHIVCTHIPRMQALLLSGQLVCKLTCSSLESPKKNIQEVASSVSLAPEVVTLESQIIVVSRQLGCNDTC